LFVLIIVAMFGVADAEHRFCLQPSIAAPSCEESAATMSPAS
jgi:hypothetical protein